MKKQDKFINDIALEYQKNGFNIKQAYKKLRPKVKDSTAEVEGSKILRNPKFKARLAELGEKVKTRYNIDMEELVNDLKKIKDYGLEQIPIIGGKEGEIYGYKRAELSSSIKAIDTLIKVAGEYAPTKTDTNIKGEIQTNSPEMIEATNNLAKAIKSKK